MIHPDLRRKDRIASAHPYFCGPWDLFYAAFSLRETGIEAAWAVGSLVICASVLVHGVSATPLTKLYGRLPKNV